VALQNAPLTVFNQDRESKYTWIHNPVLYDLHEMLGKHDRGVAYFIDITDRKQAELERERLLARERYYFKIAF
jgi:hypothetical protein